jgi:hypothetical protein
MDDDDDDMRIELTERNMTTLIRCITLLIALSIIAATVCTTAVRATRACPTERTERDR